VAVATFLADTSAYARLHHGVVFDRLAPMIERGLVATCSVIDLEMLFSTRSARDHEQVLRERSAFERLDVEQVDWDRAVAVQGRFALRSMTRSVGIPDLLTAAVAERHRVAVLHYHQDFTRIGELTGQPTEWVVPQGSVP